jgi:intein/homing endonuclease
MPEITLPFKWRHPQKEIFDNMWSHRFNVLVAHRRMGKTVLVIIFIIFKALTAINNKLWQPRYAYVAPFRNQAKLIAWEYIKKYAGKIPTFKANESELWVEFLGARVYLFGADNPDAMRGMYWDGVVLDEYPQIKQELWGEVIMPALSDRKGWAIFLGTPKGMNHFYDLLNTAMKLMADKNDAWWAGVYRADETGVIPDDELALLRKSISENQYRQEFLCCLPGSKVYTNKGQVAIEDIRVGDIVLSHSGRFRQVQTTVKHRHVGDIVKIRTYGDAKTVDVTPNHPVRLLDKATQTYRWVPAGEVKPGDLMVRPRRKMGEQVLRPEMAELLAWYICEGSASKTGVNIAVGAIEDIEAKRIRACCDALNYGYHETVSGSVRQFTIMSTSFADLVVSQCGKMAHNKRIPWELISGHEKLVYDVLMLGDGCIHVTKRDFRELNVFVTVSENLAYDVQMLAGMMGYRAGISRKAGGDSVIMGRSVKVKEKFNVRIDPTPRKLGANAKTYPAKHGIGVKVKSVDVVSYDGSVYNLEVQHDNSYVVNGRTVHNCDFSASVDNILITIDAVSEAMKRKKREEDLVGAAKVLGVDVARFGDDRSVIFRRQGSQAFWPKVYSKLDNMTLVGLILQEIEDFRPDAVFIDSGRGEGVIDRLRQLTTANVVEVNFGGMATKFNHYYNKRAEMYDNAREWIETVGALPDLPALKAELVVPTYTYDQQSRMKLESKEEIKKRLGRSCDLSDAFILTFAYPAAAGAGAAMMSGGLHFAKTDYDPLKGVS